MSATRRAMARARGPAWLPYAPGGRAGRLLDRLGLTWTGASMIAIALLGWVLARTLGGRGVFLMAYAAVALVVSCWLLGRQRIAIQATRSSLPKRVPVSRTVEVDIELVAKRPLSNIVLEEALSPELAGRVLLPVAALPAGRTVARRYTFQPTRRGVFRVGPLVATRIDPFALTKTQTVLAPEVEIIVHPAVERVHDRVLTRQWEDPPIRPPVSKPWPSGYDLFGMREYADGDDPRRIVWRATARAMDPATGGNLLLVREAEQGITDRVVLVLDTDAAHYHGADGAESFELAVKTLASLAVRHLKDGFAVTVELSGRRLFDGLRGEKYRVKLLDELARVQPEQVPLERAVSRLVHDRRRPNLHVVAITPKLDRDAAARLRTLIQRGASVLVAVVLPARFDSAALQRVQSIGCNVVEIRPGVALEHSFRRVMGRDLARGH